MSRIVCDFPLGAKVQLHSKGWVLIKEDECHPEPCIGCVFESCGNAENMLCASMNRKDKKSIIYAKHTPLWKRILQLQK